MQAYMTEGKGLLCPQVISVFIWQISEEIVHKDNHGVYTHIMLDMYITKLDTFHSYHNVQIVCCSQQ